MGKWENEKSSLEFLVSEGISYEEIGRRYGCTGANIKKQCRKLGIIVPKRRKINEKETFNKGVRTKKCIVCGKYITRGSFCSRECSLAKKEKDKIDRWLNGENFVRGSSQVPKFIRKYIIDMHQCKCERCGWGEKNEKTGLVPLQIHHKDGDCTNNNIENLEVLCPNCHSLTDTFGSLNKESKRFHRAKKKKGE